MEILKCRELCLEREVGREICLPLQDLEAQALVLVAQVYGHLPELVKLANCVAHGRAGGERTLVEALGRAASVVELEEEGVATGDEGLEMGDGAGGAEGEGCLGCSLNRGRVEAIRAFCDRS